MIRGTRVSSRCGNFKVFYGQVTFVAWNDQQKCARIDLRASEEAVQRHLCDLGRIVLIGKLKDEATELFGVCL